MERLERVGAARSLRDRQRPAVVRELAVRKSGGQWAPLGQNLVPEFYVKSGVRRMTTQQGAPLIKLGVDITPEVIEKEQVVRVLGCAVRHSRRSAGAAARGRRGPARGARPAGTGLAE